MLPERRVTHSRRPRVGRNVREDWASARRKGKCKYRVTTTHAAGSITKDSFFSRELCRLWEARWVGRVPCAVNTGMAAVSRWVRGRCAVRNGICESYGDRDELLMELGFASYRDYLNSDLWKSIRSRVMRRWSRRCKLCGDPAIDVHHINYTKSGLLGKKLTQLRPLCRTCHEKVELCDSRKLPLRMARNRYFAVIRSNKRNRKLR